MYHFFLYPFLVILLLGAIRYALIWSQLLRVSFRYPSYNPQPLASVPSPIQEIFRPERSQLAISGFQLCGYYLVERIDSWSDDRGKSPPVWELLLHQPQLHTYAKVAIRRPVEAVDLFEVEFYTKFTDGTWLMTVNGKAHGILGRIPDTILQDSYAARSDVPWQLHYQKLNILAETHSLAAIEPTDFIVALAAQQHAYIDGLQQRKQIVPQGRGCWHIHWITALKILPTVDRGLWRASKLLRQRHHRYGKEVSFVPIALELDSFLWMEGHQQKSLDPKIKMWLLAGSFILFIASYIHLISATNLAILLAVLLLHEGGHLLAMKLCGYNRHSLLFLPFLGAVAAARKDNATMTDKTIVALAGPIPGLILGIVLAVFTNRETNPDWLNTAIGILISLNVFNLLPIYPLDGGQVADVLFFSRHPYTDICFKLLGVILFTAVGISNPVALIFSFLILLSIPSSFRTAKLYRQLRRENPAQSRLDREELLVIIFDLLYRSGLGKRPFPQRYLLAKQLLQRDRDNQTNWWMRISLGTVYSLSLLGGVGGSWLALFPQISIPRSVNVNLSHDRSHRPPAAIESKLAPKQSSGE